MSRDVQRRANTLGEYWYGKPPTQTFIESATLAHDKQLDRLGHSFDLTTASA